MLRAFEPHSPESLTWTPSHSQYSTLIIPAHEHAKCRKRRPQRPTNRAYAPPRPHPESPKASAPDVAAAAHDPRLRVLQSQMRRLGRGDEREGKAYLAMAGGDAAEALRRFSDDVAWEKSPAAEKAREVAKSVRVLAPSAREDRAKPWSLFGLHLQPVL